MKRSVLIYVLSLLMAAPLAWLVLTTPLGAEPTGWVLLSGALITGGALIRLAWQMHRAGRLLPNRCVTCDHPLVLSRPGELRPPSSVAAADVRMWRCRHCGRLAAPYRPWR